MRRIRRVPVLTALLLLGTLGVAAIALADTLQVNDLVTGGDVTVEVGDTGTAVFVLQAANGDGKNGCNATGSGDAVTFNVSSSDPSVVTLASSTVSVTGCGNTNAQLGYTAVGPGSATISATYVSGGAEGAQSAAAYNTADTLTVTVNAATPSDTTPPDITITTPADGAVYTLGQSVLADYSCSDSESAVTRCAGPVASGDAIDTASVGSKSFTVDAESDGGASSATHSYSVVYSWNGFFRPVDNGGVLNVVKAGSSVPIKFSLAGDQGLDVVTRAASRTINCSAGSSSDVLENTVTAGQSALSYDAAADQYTYVWKTDKGWSSSCREFSLELNDGTVHTALFKFSK